MKSRRPHSGGTAHAVPGSWNLVLRVVLGAALASAMWLHMPALSLLLLAAFVILPMLLPTGRAVEDDIFVRAARGEERWLAIAPRGQRVFVSLTGTLLTGALAYALWLNRMGETLLAAALLILFKAAFFLYCLRAGASHGGAAGSGR